MRLRCSFGVLIATALLLLIGQPARACGPCIPWASFETPDAPDFPPEPFRHGQLGILRPNLSDEELTIAWRILRGLEVPEPDAKPRVDPAEAVETAKDAWLQARNAQLPDSPVAKIEPFAHPQGDNFSFYNRINPDAFRRATETLRQRIRQYPNQQDAIRNWILGQDLVFTCTSKDSPLPDPVSAPTWLRVDRDYQRAACLFYSCQWEEARQAFRAIQTDPVSPWREWGAYLQARCWVREASLGPRERPASAPNGAVAFALPALEPYLQAERQLRVLLAAGVGPEVGEPSEDYLCLVRHRTDPEGLFREALADLVAPRPKTFWKSLEVFQSARTASYQIHETWNLIDSLDLPPKSKALLDWLGATRGYQPGYTPLPVYQEAKERWDQDHSLVWLVAALMACPNDSKDVAPLLEESDKVRASNPASITLRWHSLRIRLAQAGPKSLAAKLDLAMKESFPIWAINQLRRQRAPLSQNMAEWAGFLGLQPTTGEPSAKANGMVLLDTPTTLMLNESLTAAQLRELALEHTLPANLRSSMVRSAWMRAILTSHWNVAGACVPNLEPALRAQARSILASTDPGTRDFELVRLVLDYPGLTPFLAPDLGGNRYQKSLSQLDGLRFNWWCSAATNQKELSLRGADSPLKTRAILPEWLQQDASRERLEELDRLHSIPEAQIWFAEVALAYAKKHPNDARVPETLHKIVASTRSPRCTSPAVTEASKSCFRMLHRNYPKSAWTRKTPYYF